MTGCELRATGRFSPEKFLERHPFRERVCAGRGLLVVTVSSARDLHVQIKAAVAFVERYRDTLSALKAFPGVELLSLEFGLGRVASASQSITFPPPITAAAGRLGMRIVVCLSTKLDD